jgi:flagellar basal body-associated protein FliL
MMETLKRHLFLISLIVGVVVISAAVLVLVLLLCKSPTDANKKTYNTVRLAAQTLASGPHYTSEIVNEVIDEAKADEKQYADLIEYISKLGAARPPLVPTLFPQSTELGLRVRFKTSYLKALDDLAKRLDAVPPPSVAVGAEGTVAKAEPERTNFLMYYHQDLTFGRPDWTLPTHTEAPSLQECRIGQENLWLMSDLVGVVEKMEKDLMGKAEHKIEDSPVKELIEIRIGGEASALSGSTMTPISGRFVPEAKPGATRAPALMGRWSLPDEKDPKGFIVKLGMYKVLPWKLVVVIESQHAGELVRRLKGTESFLAVDALQERPLTESMFSGSRDWMAEKREVYGKRGVVRLEVVGESLIFQLDGGRLTTPPLKEVKAAAEAPAKG